MGFFSFFFFFFTRLQYYYQSMLPPAAAAAGGLLALALALLLLLKLKLHSPPPALHLPPSPPSLPIIGHLHLLHSLPHRSLSHLSSQYGPILFLRLGSIPAVVVSSASLAKLFLLTHDKIFANRPNLELCNRVSFGYDNGVVFSRYGPRWKQMRKISNLELFSSARLQDFQHVKMEEITLMLQDLKNHSQEGRLALDIGKFLGTLTVNIMGRLLISKTQLQSSQGSTSLKDLIHEIGTAAGVLVVGDFIPYLGWLDVKTKRSMDRLHSRIDIFLEDLLAERQHDREKNPRASPNDFLDVLLSNTEAERLSKDTIKATLMDMLGAGSDTASVTVEWAMAELLRSPVTLNKLQSELDSIVGLHRRVEQSDMPRLPYLNAVIKETFRLHPPAPLLIPHASSETCKVAEYILLANTRLIVNAWAIGRDPKIWEKPEEFLPERFKDMNIDIRGQNFELLPFGSGRRSCPGIAMGISMVELMLSNLVHSFEWELPFGHTPETLDMTEEFGITAYKARPLLAIPKPRLASGN